MVISYNSQLGLRFSEKIIKKELLELLVPVMEKFYADRKTVLEDKLKVLQELISELESKTEESLDEEKERYQSIIDEKIEQQKDQHYIFDKVYKCFGENFIEDIFTKGDTKYFMICESVYKAAELIKVSSGFTGRTLKDINFGSYTYLMGKNRMIRFQVVYNAIRGFYFDNKHKTAFEWGIEMEDGGYFFYGGFGKEFTEIMRVLTFVELGDIEILELKGGRNNGGKKDKDKITNTSKNTVFVVDSSWNKIIIRTTGFAVRGHFRLQPCGENHKDRKLTWIDAFEKHGYKRRPTAEIVR